jgi:formimidoylglutamate deiminase
MITDKTALHLRYFRFNALLQREDWLSPAYVGVDAKGVVRYLSNQPHPEGSAVETILGYALPGFQNTHSHAFQYAMAGLAENHPAGKEDDFWSWREEMYKCALSVGPDEAEAIAAMLYAEMLRHGYTHVAEFHYLHHDKEGKPYTHLAEMGERMVAAAQTAGINITLIPVFYQKGGFGLDPQPRQRRFISRTLDDYLHLLEASKNMVHKYPHSRLGFSVHSLRAVGFPDIARTVDLGPADLPFHIHMAEQQKEVMDCLAFCGMRPMQWLLENLPVNDRFHLVHSTHLDDQELNGIIRAKANVVLCPSTEGNLGDGIFRMKEFYALDGRWSIGTDSHIGLNPWEEFKMMDYLQRLTTHRRNTFSGDASKYLVNEEIATGRKAMGTVMADHFAIGQPFDALIIDAKAPLLENTSLQNILSSTAYAGDVATHLGTLVKGQWVVIGQRHIRREAIREKFSAALRYLNNR